MTQLLTSEELSKASGGLICQLIPNLRDKLFIIEHTNEKTGKLELDDFVAPELKKHFEAFQKPFHVVSDTEPCMIIEKFETLEEAKKFATNHGYSTELTALTP